MARRRAYAAFVVLAVVATAWLLFGRGDADRGHRAPRQRASGPGLPKLPEAKPSSPDTKPGSDPAPAGPESPAATSRIAVRVIDVDGSPAVGATVEAYPGAFGFPGGARPRAFDEAPTATATTGRDGSATLKVAPGAHSLRAFRGAAANIPVFVTADGPEATLVLEPARSLKGIVLLPDGAPARGFTVSLTFARGGHSARFGGPTDERGEFELPMVPDAWLDRLVAEVGVPDKRPMLPGGPGLETPAIRCEFEFGREQLLGGTITLQLTVVRLHARVVDEAGSPVAHALVLWAPLSAPEPPSFRPVAATDEDGRFDAALQRVAGEAFVIRAPGYAPLVWRPEAQASDRKMHVPEIVLRRGVPLAGRVTDPQGHAIKGAAVRLESPRLRGQIVDQQMADAEGRFRFEGVAEEEHVLYAFRPADPDLCLPQLRMPGVRGGPDEVRVVLPEPIHGTVRFVARGTGEALSVEHLTLIVKDARGAEVAKRTWDPGQALGQVRFEVWQEGVYDIEVYTALQEPARVSGVNVVRGRGPEVPVPLVPRR